MVRIIVVDSQTDFRDSIVKFLSAQEDFAVVGVGNDGFDALKLTESLKPDVAILEFEMPMINATKISPSLKMRSPDTSIVILTSTADDDTVLRIISTGLSGYILRSSVLDEISMAVHRVNEGSYYMSDEIASHMIRLFSEFIQEKPVLRTNLSVIRNDTLEPILVNKIELKIAQAIGRGCTNRQISEELELKEGTVRNYISVILQKTGLKHRTQIAIYAVNNGFADKNDAVKRDTPMPNKRKLPSAIPTIRQEAEKSTQEPLAKLC
jgi:DNA-binding NarL/FixJ family response regulator